MPALSIVNITVRLENEGVIVKELLINDEAFTCVNNIDFRNMISYTRYRNLINSFDLTYKINVSFIMEGIPCSTDTIG